MIKKCLLLVATMMVSICASAQFQEGKGYIGASLTGLDLHYNAQDGFNVGLEAKAGFFPWDNFMVLGNVSAVHNGSEAVADHISIGAGVKFLHANHSYNDMMPGLEVGYAFFLNRSVTIEPAIYYDQSFKSSRYSTVGFKLGVGVYLFDD